MERPPIDVQLVKTEPDIDVIKFLKECQKTHTEWAEYFEKDPEIEAQYVGSGEWEDAAAHRQLEKQYNQVIQKYLSLEAEKVELERRDKAYDKANKDFQELLIIANKDRAELKAKLKEAEENEDILRELLWLNHGHDGLYGDDGEMQCSKCMSESGFYDYRRFPAKELKEAFFKARLKEHLDKVVKPRTKP